MSIKPAKLHFPGYIVNALRSGYVGVIPTDTIYGVVGSAALSETVKRIYSLRKRDSKKPFIVLAHSAAALKTFGVKLDKYHRAFLKEAWPGPISVILPLAGAAARKKYRYLHRGTGSLAFRVPANADIQGLLKKTGPLVAPSANRQGHAPARTIKEAQKVFGPDVDFYLDAGRLAGKASTLIDLRSDTPKVLRK